MYDTDLLFPSRFVPELGDLRSPVWQDLVAKIKEQPEDSVEYLAFILLMVRLCNCVACNIDSYRAMLGCGECSRLVVNRFRDSDEKLFEKYKSAREFILAQSGSGKGS